MIRTTIADLKPGMTLAKPARDINGRLIIGEGAILTENHIRTLKSWGVTEILVQGDSADADDANSSISEDAWNAARSHAKLLFRHSAPDDPLTEEIIRLSVRRLAGQIAEKPELADELAARQDQPPEPVDEAGQRAQSVDPNRLIHDNTELASLPTVLSELIEAINDPRSSAAAIARVVGQDTSLSARLLKIVNSPFYGFPQKIDTISRAVTILGSRQLTMLAMGVAAIDMFKDIPSDVCDMESFWKHGIAVGVIARILASHCSIANTERLFVAGLLHDIGHLILYKHLPDQAKTALSRAAKDDTPLFSKEVEVMGFNHARLGAILLKQWKLPPTLENCVKYHHHPIKAMAPKEPAIVHLANSMAYALDLGSAGERFVPPLDPRILEHTGLPLGSLEPATAQIDVHFHELIRMFLQ